MTSLKTKFTDFDLDAALAFATAKHAEQTRKDAARTPYIEHPKAVAAILIEHGVEDRDTLYGALLHDTLEDTDTTWDELVEHFGHKTANAVLEVTNDPEQSKTEQKRQQILKAQHFSPEAKRIKLADKTCNFRDILETPPTHWPSKTKLAYLEHGKQVVDGLRGICPSLEAVFDALYQRGIQEFSPETEVFMEGDGIEPRI